MGSHNYDLVLDSITTILGQAWNKKYSAGIPIAALDPDLAMISGLVKNSTISPFVSDGWMYAGFNMAADAPFTHELSFETTEAEKPHEQLVQFLQWKKTLKE